MKRNFEKGITLVSLVVTIIVLIILAAVSINVMIGQDGIITKAKQAAENMELATLEEQERLNELSSYLSGESTEGGVAYDKIAELNQKYNALNTEYSNFKSTIATAITDMGVTTAEDADSETMSSNIRSLNPFNSSGIKYLYNKGAKDNGFERLVVFWKSFESMSIVENSDNITISIGTGEMSRAGTPNKFDITDVKSIEVYYKGGFSNSDWNYLELHSNYGTSNFDYRIPLYPYKDTTTPVSTCMDVSNITGEYYLVFNCGGGATSMIIDQIVFVK